MAYWLPWVLLCFVAVLLAAMPWHRPYPNHQFMLHMLGLLQDEDDKTASNSSSIGVPPGSMTIGRPPRTDTGKSRTTLLLP
jgi:hypothetical protein